MSLRELMGCCLGLSGVIASWCHLLRYEDVSGGILANEPAMFISSISISLIGLAISGREVRKP